MKKFICVLMVREMMDAVVERRNLNSRYGVLDQRGLIFEAFDTFRVERPRGYERLVKLACEVGLITSAEFAKLAQAEIGQPQLAQAS